MESSRRVLADRIAQRMTVEDGAISYDGEAVGRFWRDHAGWRFEWRGIKQKPIFDPTKPAEVAELWAVHEVAALLAMQQQAS
jgi:hypothetical protein